MNIVPARQLLNLLIAFLLPGFLFGQNQTGNTYYVSPQGNDRNNGSMSAPWATIEHAFAKTRPGDTILLRAGIHEVYDKSIEGNVGGAPGLYKTLAAYPGEEAVITRERGLRVLAPYVRIRGIVFRNSFVSAAAGNAEILNNKFSGDCGYGCVNAHGDNHLIEGNTIDNMTVTGTKHHGMYIHGGKNIVIRNNYVNFNSEGYAIHVFEDRKPVKHAGLVIEGNRIGGSLSRSGILLANPIASMDDVLIRNNVIVNNWQNGIRVRENVANLKIYNNTFYHNGDSDNATDAQGAISFRFYLPGTITIKNNIFHDDNVHVQNRENSPNIVLERNLYWPRPVTTIDVTDAKPVVSDPLFIDAEHGNFQLDGKSPAIDAGVDLGFPFIGSAPDLGAFELVKNNLR
jgi:parallel beta-helix repeat protein